MDLKSENESSPENVDDEEPEIIVLQYETDVIEEDCDGENKNIILQVSEEQIAPFLGVNKGTAEEYKDQPDLIKREDFDSKSNSTEGGDTAAAALCVEAQYDTEVTCAVDSIADDQPGRILLYDHLNKDASQKESTDDTEEVQMLVLCQAASEADIDRFLCILCDLVVGCIYCLKTHYETQHSNVGFVQYQCSRQYEKAIDICPKCNLICKDQEDVTIHRSIHFVKCTICGTFFDSPLYLSNHCKMMHKNFEVVLSCDLCNEWFKDLTFLSNHYENSHKLIICIVCLKRYPTRELLEDHHRSHTLVIKQETVLPFACNKCDMAFEQINDLCRHITQEHPRRK